MRFENSELRAFRAVIEQGGFRRAGEALHISQSAVSQAVSGLEAKLDAPLLQRGKNLKLTAAGKRLFDHAVEVLRDEQQVIEDIAQLKLGREKTLNMALSASVNYFYGAQLISAYYQKNPRSRIKLAEMPSRSMVNAVLSGAVELGFGPFQKHMPAVDTLALYSDTRHLVVSPRHPQYAQMIAGDEQALRHTALIASALDNPDVRPSIQRLRDKFSTVWEVSSLSLRIHMVAQGMGVSFLERQLLREHPKCSELVVMDDVSFGRIERQVGLYFRRGKQLSDCARQFIELCEQHWNL